MPLDTLIHLSVLIWKLARTSVRSLEQKRTSQIEGVKLDVTINCHVQRICLNSAVWTIVLYMQRARLCFSSYTKPFYTYYYLNDIVIQTCLKVMKILVATYLIEIFH